MAARLLGWAKAFLAIFALWLVAFAGPAFAQGVTYTYDPQGHLQTAVYSNGTMVTYTYDAAGNRTGETIAGGPPIAGPVSIMVAINSTADNVPLNLSGPIATSVAVSAPAGHGTATASGVTITYTPTNGYAGSDSFQYTASNGAGTSAAATVSVTVISPPVAGPVSTSVAYNSTNNPITLNLSGGPASTVAVSSPATHGTATASGTSITYTPTSGYSGADSFQYTGSNIAGTSAAATVSITVNSQPPVANNVSATVAENTTNDPITLNITGGAPTSVAVSTQATHGTATASGTSITYTPTSGYTGSDSFKYTATNAAGTSSPATASITVNPLAPVANNVSATVAENTTNDPITLNITGGAPTSVAVSLQPSHGTATASGTSITYTPRNGYTGSDSFWYTATNSYGTSASATASITVNPQPPVANSVNTSVTENTTNDPIALNITGGPPTSVAVSTQATHGTATASGTSIKYTPTSGYTGSDTFKYTATNAGGTSAPATVSITVLTLTATFSPTLNCPTSAPTGVCQKDQTPSETFPTVTANVTGGSGSYTYAWTPTATSGGVWASGTAVSFTPSVSEVAQGATAQATYSVTVTDTVTGARATSNAVVYTYSATGGGACGPAGCQ